MSIDEVDGEEEDLPPRGSPHDIAVQAYNLARRAIRMHQSHQRECAEFWREQRLATESLRAQAASNYRAASDDRALILEEFNKFKRLLGGWVARGAFWLVTTMGAALAACIWWIVTHPHGG